MMDVEKWLAEKRPRAWNKLRKGSITAEEHFQEEKVRAAGVRREQLLLTFNTAVQQFLAYDELIQTVELCYLEPVFVGGESSHREVRFSQPEAREEAFEIVVSSLT